MPNDVKALVSAVTLIVAAAFAYWEHGGGRSDLAWFAFGTGLFMVVAMWIFPEAAARNVKDKS